MCVVRSNFRLLIVTVGVPAMVPGAEMRLKLKSAVCVYLYSVKNARWGVRKNRVRPSPESPA
jgi:hypothetical protein